MVGVVCEPHDRVGVSKALTATLVCDYSHGAGLSLLQLSYEYSSTEHLHRYYMMGYCLPKAVRSLYILGLNEASCHGRQGAPPRVCGLW